MEHSNQAAAELVTYSFGIMRIKDIIWNRFQVNTLTSFKIFLVKVEISSQLWMLFLSSLFHSNITDGKKGLFEKVATNSKLQNAFIISGLIVTVWFGNLMDWLLKFWKNSKVSYINICTEASPRIILDRVFLWMYP